MVPLRAYATMMASSCLMGFSLQTSQTSWVTWQFVPAPFCRVSPQHSSLPEDAARRSPPDLVSLILDFMSPLELREIIC